MISVIRGSRRLNTTEQSNIEIIKPIQAGFESRNGYIVGRIGEEWVVYDNVCNHNGGRLRVDSGGATATCPVHGWRLDLAKGKYDNGCPKAKLDLSESAENLLVTRKIERFPELSREDLTDAAIEFHFNAHASVSAGIQDISLITDPWLDGSCFATGWWHLFPPSSDALNRLSMSSVIFISHNHPDHLHIPTLLKYVARDQLFLVPKFESGSVERVLRANGFHNIVAADFMEEIVLKSPAGTSIKVLILKSGDERDDSSLLVYTKSNVVFFAVDTNMPNRWILPNVDILFTPFAGGASGFPSRIDNFTEQEKMRIAERNRSSIFSLHLVKLLQATNPRYVVPYAGYFTESARDNDVAIVNRKNTKSDVLRFIEQKFPLIRGIDPIENHRFALNGPNLDVFGDKYQPKPEIDANYVSAEIARFHSGAPMLTRELLERFGHSFIDSGFVDELTVIIIPCTDFFQQAGKYYLELNFSKSTRGYALISEPAPPPLVLASKIRHSTTNNIEILRVRADSLRGLIHQSLPLEDLSIGFQIRMFRDPNVYNFKFWDYFTNVYSVGDALRTGRSTYAE
jgi:CMP-N-acetylneuraminate monooxygenase